VSHQIGRRIDLLFRSINDVEKKIDCSLRYQHTMVKSSMLMMQSDAKENRSRKRKNTMTDSGHGNTQHAGLLDFEEISDDFPSLRELAVMDRKRALAGENNDTDTLGGVDG